MIIHDFLCFLQKNITNTSQKLAKNVPKTFQKPSNNFTKTYYQNAQTITKNLQKNNQQLPNNRPQNLLKTSQKLIKLTLTQLPTTSQTQTKNLPTTYQKSYQTLHKNISKNYKKPTKNLTSQQPYQKPTCSLYTHTHIPGSGSRAGTAALHENAQALPDPRRSATCREGTPLRTPACRERLRPVPIVSRAKGRHARGPTISMKKTMVTPISIRHTELQLAGKGYAQY